MGKGKRAIPIDQEEKDLKDALEKVDVKKLTKLQSGTQEMLKKAAKGGE